MSRNAMDYRSPALIRAHAYAANLARKLHKTIDLLRMLDHTIDILGKAGIPSLVAGGIAVQNYGYPRFAADLEVIVPDIERARAPLETRGYRAACRQIMQHPHGNMVWARFLEGGKRLIEGRDIFLPVPQEVTREAIDVSLEELVTIKLADFIREHNLYDYTDVVELIHANDLPRDFDIDPYIKEDYEEIWDDICTR